MDGHFVVALLVSAVLLHFHIVSGAESQDVPGSILLLERIEPEVVEDEHLHELLSRVGPNMRSASNYHDFSDRSLNDSIAAWILLEGRVKSYAQRQVRHYQPKVERLLEQANVSDTCTRAIQSTFNALSDLESWAFQSK